MLAIRHALLFKDYIDYITSREHRYYYIRIYDQINSALFIRYHTIHYFNLLYVIYVAMCFQKKIITTISNYKKWIEIQARFQKYLKFWNRNQIFKLLSFEKSTFLRLRILKKGFHSKNFSTSWKLRFFFSYRKRFIRNQSNFLLLKNRWFHKQMNYFWIWY